MKAALQWAAVIITANIASSLSAPPAHADPTDDLVHDSAMFCREMDRDSTPAGVKSHIEDMYADGLDVETAKSVVGYALSAICPEYEDEVEAAAALYAPKLEMA